MKKALCVLKSLGAGIPVSLDGYTYCMTEEYDIVMQTSAYKDGKLVPSDIYLNTDLTVGQFIRLCETKISDADAFLLTANITLNSEGFKARRY